MRALNRRLLLRLLREQGPTSRTDLAEPLRPEQRCDHPDRRRTDRRGLPRRAVGRRVDRRPSAGVTGPGHLRAGRRRSQVDGRRDSGGSRRHQGCRRCRRAGAAGLARDRRGAGPSGRSTVDDLLAAAGTTRDRLGGIGLCMPGSIDWRDGVCKLSPFFGWSGCAGRGEDARADRRPVSVDNDVNALAVAESSVRPESAVPRLRRHHPRPGRRRRTGCPAAASTAGRAVARRVRTHRQPSRRTRCECGNAGCLEAYVGEHACRTAARLGESVRRYGIDRFISLARDGDSRSGGSIYAR